MSFPLTWFEEISRVLIGGGKTLGIKGGYFREAAILLLHHIANDYWSCRCIFYYPCCIKACRMVGCNQRMGLLGAKGSLYIRYISRASVLESHSNICSVQGRFILILSGAVTGGVLMIFCNVMSHRRAVSIHATDLVLFRDEDFSNDGS